MFHDNCLPFIVGGRVAIVILMTMPLINADRTRDGSHRKLDYVTSYIGVPRPNPSNDELHFVGNVNTRSAKFSKSGKVQDGGIHSDRRRKRMHLNPLNAPSLVRKTVGLQNAPVERLVGGQSGVLVSRQPGTVHRCPVIDHTASDVRHCRHICSTTSVHSNLPKGRIAAAQPRLPTRGRSVCLVTDDYISAKI